MCEQYTDTKYILFGYINSFCKKIQKLTLFTRELTRSGVLSGSQ